MRSTRASDLGDALGGLVLLAVAGSLPELAITISAASQGNLPLAAGNLIGGIAVQTMVLLHLRHRGRAGAAAHVSRGPADAGARGAARDHRPRGSRDGLAAQAIDGDRRRRQPRLARDRRVLGRGPLRDPAGGQGSALEGRDAGQPAGTPPPGACASRPAASVCRILDRAGRGHLRRWRASSRSAPACCSR